MADNSKFIGPPENGERDEGFLRTLFTRKFNIVLLSLGLAILAAVAIISTPFGGENLFEILSGSAKFLAIELAFAFWIAAILSAGIEESTRKRFHKEVDKRIVEIQQNVFRSTYGRHLPEAFTNEVEELLFRSKFVHSNSRVQFNFGRPNSGSPSPGGIINVKVTHEFSVRNLTAFSAQHRIPLHVQDLQGGEELKDCVIESVWVEGYETFVDEQLSQINESSRHCGGFREFELETPELRPGDDVFVRVGIRTMMRMSGFAFARCCRPTKGMTVVATFPERMDLRTIGADATHRRDCKSVASPDDDNEFSWAIEGAVLPYQGIIFWWDAAPRT